MKQTIPQITLHNGVTVPVLSVGTYKVENLDAVLAAAFDAGLTAVDAAEHYGNEAAVGQAIASSGVARERLYLSTKIWNKDHGYERALEAFEESVQRLQTEPDMLLIHWPCPMNGLYCDTWRAFQKLYADGRVRAIGVSNFKVSHLKVLQQLGGVQPMVNQVEMHPFFIDDEMLAFCRENGIQVEAWSPLLRGKAVISDPLVNQMAEKYHCSPAKLAIRYLTQYGVRAIVKSSNPEHIAENANTFDFELSPEDFQAMRTLNAGKRVFQDPDEYYL